MTVYHLHAIMPEDTGFIRDAPDHRLLSCGPVAAMVTLSDRVLELSSPDPNIASAFALRHHKLLTQYCKTAPVLPLRIGSCFSSQDAVRAAVSINAERYQTALAHLAQHQEFTITINVLNAVENGDVSLPPPDGGRRFLEKKRASRDQRVTQKQRQHRFVATALHDLQRLGHGVSLASQPRHDRPLHVAGLFDASNRDALLHWAKDHDYLATCLGLNITVSGPWPAYSFTFETFNLDCEICYAT